MASNEEQMASENRSVEHGFMLKNRDGSVSSSSLRIGRPSGPGIRSTRPYTRR